jgi:ubiquinone/menaquinone biosynthesis C-methylase UbiE
MSQAEEQKRQTRDNWVSRAGNWNDWAGRLEKQQKGLNAPLIEAAEIEPGLDVLDLASGTGEPALTIAGRVGSEGSVTATDLVAEMLAGAERRAAEKGLANMRFQVTDMETLPFDDASFDRVTCRLGLMYVPQPAQALIEARRVLRPGGRAAFLVWGAHEENYQFIVLDEVLWQEMRIDPHEGAFGPTRFGEAGALAAVFQEAGFEQVEERVLDFAPRIDPATGFWRAQLALRLGERLNEMNEADHDRLDAAMAKGFERYRDGDRIQLKTTARIGLGVA